MRVSRRVLLAAVFSATIASRLARAQASEDGPTAPILALNAALIGVIKAGDAVPFVQRYRMLAPAIDQAFDLEHVIEVSVGFYWSSLPQAQQQKLLEVFRDFTIATYVANFQSYDGEVAAVAPATRAVGAQQVVTSTLTRPSGDVVRIDYVMGRTVSGWKVEDVLLDGTISRVAVQRSDFSSLLAQGNAAPLIASLGQKVSTLSDGSISS